MPLCSFYLYEAFFSIFVAFLHGHHRRTSCTMCLEQAFSSAVYMLHILYCSSFLQSYCNPQKQHVSHPLLFFPLCAIIDCMASCMLRACRFFLQRQRGGSWGRRVATTRSWDTISSPSLRRGFYLSFLEGAVSHRLGGDGSPAIPSSSTFSSLYIRMFFQHFLQHLFCSSYSCSAWR